MIITAYGDRTKPNVIVGTSAVRARRIAEARSFTYRRFMNPYWWEFGTAPRFTKKGARRGQIMATPYFRPAVTANLAKVRDILASGIFETIDALVDRSK
jgi:hypothetical protein